MTKRNLLKPGDKIILSDDRTISHEWEIISIVGEGASAVCYFARSGKKQGRLKEFYPLNLLSLIRDEKNQLVPSESDIEKFREMCSEYENSFKILDEIRNENGLMLNNFIPVQEIFYGTASVYVWSPDDKHGVTFENYLKKVRQNPNELPVKKLFTILRILATLANFVKFFHNRGVVYLDLKPSNFLVTYTSDFDVNPAHLSLFDTNSLYDLKSDLPFRTLGTEGFSAPELKYEKVSHRSDIYSMGCILFYAIIVEEKTVPDGLYKPNHYSILNQLVARSELLNSGVVSANVSLQSILIHILKRALAHNPANRYSNCDELINDLFRALMILMPGISSQTELLRDIHKKLVLIDDESPGVSSPTIIIQDLLYKKPILTLKKNSQDINIIVIGAGTFAQKFMDQALQAVQVPFIDDMKNFSDRKIVIRAYSNNPDYDREIYLATRPALPKFVNVNGSLKSSAESYGQIDFLQVPRANSSKGFSVANIEQNKKIIDEIILLAEAEKAEINYIFVALGDDDLNQQIAEAFFDATQALEMNCPINFVVHDNNFSYKKFSVNPVFIARKILPETISLHLERMAFNTHLSYFGTLSGVNIDEVKKDYNDRYNHESSLAFALSVKYKLIALGIDYDDDTLNEVAEQFVKICDEPLIEILAYYEHRRWVLNMVSTGWQPPVTASGSLDYNYCLLMTRNTGKPQDRSKFLHPCILHSKCEHTLKKYPERWTLPTDGLDELDKMSVELNKSLCRKADKFREMQPLSRGNFKFIRDLVANDEKISFALNRLEFYLTQILNGNKHHSKNLDAYFKEFNDALKPLPEYTRNTISDWLENLRKDFIVVAVANRRIDYKGYDFDIVKNMTFILTYKSQPTISLAFDDNENNEQFFQNVASATILSPSRIIYLYFLDNDLNWIALTEKIRSVRIYLEERKIFAAINFLFVSEESLSKDFQNQINARMLELNVDSTIFCEKKTLIQTLVELRPDFFDGSTKLFKSNYYQGLFTQKIIEHIPYFEFNANKKCFSICCGECRHLRFISDTAFLHAVDIFRLRQATFKYNLPDDYFHYYKRLWSIYSHDNGKGGDKDFHWGIINWNRLCKLLGNYEENNFKCIDFYLKENLPTDKKYTYIFSGETKVLASLLRKLQDLGVISQYRINDNNFPDFEIDVHTNFDIEKSFDNFFKNVVNLTDENFCRFKKNRDGDIVTAIFSDLKVKNLIIDTDHQKFNVKLLENLAKSNFLKWLKITPNTEGVVPKKATFSYSSLRIKNLLLKSGTILEIYTYYKLLETGYFDDVVANFQFTWRNEAVENEIDLILVHGFSSAIIECKAKGEDFFTQEELFKFNDIAERFGIASTKILISAGTLSDKQRDRAVELGIIVIDKPKDIIDIGQTVIRIMEKISKDDE